ncbi:hypothetical protein LSH36_1088g00042 [Paralvinella palmiformis]|uniref:Uncharacterized protein n=1 Tax=Paralvinella palmiformis TaxID=53620 RepID=A0AAD9MPU5_9ANNE|nr:hypothetical protein LSH36_1088g00042 [Paralvinella palmiformis]
MSDVTKQSPITYQGYLENGLALSSPQYQEHTQQSPGYQNGITDTQPRQLNEADYSTSHRQNVVVVQRSETAEDIRAGRAGILSCFVIWCCCWPIGVIAYLIARTAITTLDVEKKKRLSRTSVGISIGGIMAGLIVCSVVAYYYYVTYFYY